MLFLHGFLGAAGDWDEVVDALRGDYRCVALDLPGHGRSVGLGGAEDYTMEGAARGVVATLDRLGIEAPTVVGYSMGGRLALYLALRHQRRVRALFLESASPGLEGEQERAERRLADERRARRLEAGDFEGFLRGWYAQPLFRSLAADPERLRRTLERRRGNDPRELARSLRGMGTGSQPSLWAELGGLGPPTLAVAGALDAKFVPIARRLGERAPTAEVAVVPGAGHNVRLEAPVAYEALLRGLLSPGARSG